MRRNISRSEKMIYERFDCDNWMITPKFSDIQPTSFLDVCKLSTLNEKLEPREEEVDISSILEVAINRLR